MSSRIDRLVNSRHFRSYFILEARTNFAASDEWTEIPFKTFTFEQSVDNIVSSLAVQLIWDKAYLDTTDVSQFIQMYAEVRLRQLTESMIQYRRKFDILFASAVSDHFIVTGDATTELTVGDEIIVSGTVANDGTYTVASAVYAAGETTIVVVEAVPAAAGAGGQLWHEEVVDDRVIFQGVIYEPDANEVQYTFRAYDPMVVLDKCVAHVGILRSDFVVIENCKLIVDPDVADQYIIDPATHPDGYTNDTPGPSPYDNRRTFKQIGSMYNDTYDPWEDGYWVPSDLITIGGATRDFLRVEPVAQYFTDHPGVFAPYLTSIIVWKENTLYIEEVLDYILTIDVNHGGPGWVEGIHYNMAHIITNVDTGTDIFTVRGDRTAVFDVGATFIVAESTGNDGTYTSLGAAYDSVTNTTDITVASIPDVSIDGWLSLPNPTVLPSYLSVNQMKWSFAEGSLMELIRKLLTETAAPNYRIWWDHAVGMMRAQYVEQYPYTTLTNDWSYMVAEYSATGANEATTIKSASLQFDVKHFASRVIVEGIDETPVSVFSNASGTNIYVPWGLPDAPWGAPAWVPFMQPPYTDPAGSPKYWLTDNNSSTSWGFMVDYHIQGSVHEGVWYDFCIIDAGAVYEFSKLIFYRGWSKRDFPFYLRVECCESIPGEDPANYASAAWAAISDEFSDKKLDGASVECSEFANPMFRWLRIYMRAAKLGWTDLHGVVLSDIFGLVYGGNVYGEAYVGEIGTGNEGQYYDQGGMDLPMNGLRSLKHLPLLNDQLFGPSVADANKRQSAHATAVYEDHSLTTTEMCLVRAKEILDELLRVHTHTSFSMLAHPELQINKSVHVSDVRKNLDDTFLIDSVRITPTNIECSCTKYSSTDWLGEALV